jgi:predicted metalloprotease with PDZ domain
VTNVPAGTPAYDQGLYAADHIVAVDGARASFTFLNARLEEKRPGDELRLTVFRTDELRTITVKLSGRAEENYRIAPVRQPTPEQKRLYEAWLGAPFPKAAVSD